jgi:F420-dependent oxidoreductase-like protein
MATKFGVHTGLQHTTMDELVSLWQQIEGLGFDWISIWDHFYAADLTGNPSCLEAVAAHAALAASTSRVRCGSLVYCVGYRHPAVLAKSITTIDLLSGGRADIGLGAGWSEVEYKAFGLRFPPVGERMDMLEEAAACVRGLLRSPDGFSFSGAHFSLDDAANAPRPVQDALPVWIGGGGEKRTLKIAAQFADGWNVPFVSPAVFAAKRAVLHEWCARVGRNPAEIRCAVNLGYARDEADMAEQFANLRMAVAPGVLIGGPAQVAERVQEYIEAGADQVNLALRAPWDPDRLEKAAAALGLG